MSAKSRGSKDKPSQKVKRSGGAVKKDKLVKPNGPDEPLDFLHNLINTIPEPIFVKDDQNRAIFFNDALCKVVGKNRDELLGKTTHQLFSADQADSFLKADEEVLRTGVESRIIEDIRDGTGQVKTFIALKNRYIDKSGKRYVVGILKDISDLRQIEAALRESDDWHKTLLRTATDGICQTDVNGRILEANDAYCSMTGYSRQELLKMSVADLDVGETRRDIDAHLKKIASQGWDRFTSRHRKKDGTIIDVEVTVQFKDIRGGRIITFLRDITGSKKAQKELHESKQLLQFVLDNIPQRVFCKDRNLKYLWANGSFLSDAGLSELSDLIGKTDHQLVWKANADAYQADDRKVMETDSAKLQYDEPQCKPDGTTLWLRTSKIPLHDAEGNVTSVLGTYEDITELTLARKRLLESERKYRELFEGMLDGSVVFDLSGNIVEFNAAFQSMIGYQTGEIFKLNSHDITPAKWVETKEKTILDQVKTRGYSDLYEKEFIRKDGSIVNAEVRTYLITDDIGAPLRLWSFIRDISARKLNEQKLVESETKLKTLFHAAPIGMGVIIDRTISDVNQRICEMLGHTREELVGKSTRILYATQEDFERVGEELYDQIAKRGTGMVESHWKNIEGTVLDVLLNGAPIDPANQAKGLAFTALDITERKKTEAEHKRLQESLQQSQKLESLGILAGGVAHDFNNLLTGILGHATLAMEKMPKSSLAWEHVEDIEKSARRAADLTRQLLAYSGKGRFIVEPINISDVVEDMAHLLEISISKKCVLKYHFAKNLPSVEADITQIRQVIMNLILNASEAIGEQSGVISVTTGAMECDESYLAENYLRQEIPAGNYVYLEVSDTGSGMTPEVKSRIFDPFFSTKFAGRGLGLAAVLGIIRGHKGAIKVYSEIGRGSSFKVLLPAGGSIVSGKTQESYLAGHQKGQGTILVVDDEETIRTLARKVLEAGGYTVQTASDGRGALDAFHNNADEIKAVLLDMTMPHMDGEETFRELRRIKPDVKVLLSSGYNEQDAINHFAGKGLAGFIQKPYAMKDLLEAVSKILSPQNSNGDELNSSKPQNDKKS